MVILSFRRLSILAVSLVALPTGNAFGVLHHLPTTPMSTTTPPETSLQLHPNQGADLEAYATDLWTKQKTNTNKKNRPQAASGTTAVTTQTHGPVFWCVRLWKAARYNK
jgi:hypothetical protein